MRPVPGRPARRPPRATRGSGHLQRVPLFSGFEEAELRRVAELSRIVEVPAGSEVTQMGAPGDSFFIIIDGTVAVRTPVGVSGQLPPGDFFGELILIDGEPRSATHHGDDRSPAARRRSHPLLAPLEETPDLMRRILALLSRRVRRLEQVAHAPPRYESGLTGRRATASRHTAATPSTSIRKSGWNRLLTTIRVLAGSSP